MPGNNDFLVQIPDRPQALQRRMENIGAHLAYNKLLLEAGTLILSGPTLTGHPASPAEPLPMTGSVLIFRTGTDDEVWRLLETDPFAKADVWDVEKATVTPYRCGLWKPY
ncbi:hypothetical protein DL764_005633 [Monosporascus ibericus]|uniref:YCII-related domain-containing protein n=1 Tax=Monosporascus ibericus TaxID=155417 RepID=A0A4V1XAH4_9PEZI|nr:hypothetical protein DL764_005633 [Monosporascus ibericus]